MRMLTLVLVTTLLAAEPALAGEKVERGALPAWVDRSDAARLAAGTKVDGPVQILLQDQQVQVEPNATNTYSRTILRINEAAGLQAGNISFSWRPDFDQLTVHAVNILRAGKVIDVLAGGQSFSIVRREANLESAMLDGVLTANLQPEGLQVGDLLELELSERSSDPLFAGKQSISLAMVEAPITLATTSVQWPTSLDLRTAVSPALPAPRLEQRGATKLLRVSRANVLPVAPPAGAPLRFSLPPTIDATAFGSWAEVGNLLAPLYIKASQIPATGPLRTELDKIKASVTDPNARALAALALVQDRIRYVALLMNEGGYQPADAQTTWSRRFGDCKGKTALLLGLLRELGIAAVPVAVNTIAGDAIEHRLPTAALFNHVLVRADIGGRQLWLDGTRSGDRSLSRLQAPDYRWGLELVSSGARLVPILAPVPTSPLVEYLIDFDASAGLTLPAKAKLSTVHRGSDAAELEAMLKQLNSVQRDEFMRDIWKRLYPFVTPASVAWTSDPQSGEVRFTMEGTADLDWDEGYYEADVSVGRTLSLDRKPGRFADAPVANAYPHYAVTRQTIRLPANFVRAAPQQGYPSVVTTLAGTEYRRSAAINGSTFTAEGSERTLVPEISLAEALKAKDQLKALNDERIHLTIPANYKPSAAELDQLGKLALTDESKLLDRGVALMEVGKYDSAIKDFDAVIARNPRNVWGWANRGIAKVVLDRFADAEKDFAEADRVAQDNPVVSRGRGLIAYKQNNFKRAVDLFGTSLQQEDHPFARGHRAMAYSSLGENELALADAERALRENPAWVELRLLRLNLLRRTGKKDAALAEVATLAAMTDNEFAQVSAARSYNSFGRPAEAKKAYARAIELAPKEAYIYLNRALDRPADNLAGRKADIEKALALSPNDPTAITLRADIYEQEGKYAEALRLMDRALAANPRDTDTKLRRAVILHKLGRSADSDRAFAAALPATPSASEYNNRCWEKATSGVSLQTALSDCNAALRLAPDTPAFLDSRALVYMRLGRIDDAIADYSKALATEVFPSALMGRSLAWARKGDAEKAAADRKAALEESATVEANYKSYGL